MAKLPDGFSRRQFPFKLRYPKARTEDAKTYVAIYLMGRADKAGPAPCGI